MQQGSRGSWLGDRLLYRLQHCLPRSWLAELAENQDEIICTKLLISIIKTFFIWLFSNDFLKWIQPSWHIYYQWENILTFKPTHDLFLPLFAFSASLSLSNLSNPPIFLLRLQYIPNLNRNVPHSIGTTRDLTIYMGMNYGVIQHRHSFQMKKWCKGGRGGQTFLHCYFKLCTLCWMHFLSL